MTGIRMAARHLTEWGTDLTKNFLKISMEIFPTLFDDFSKEVGKTTLQNLILNFEILHFVENGNKDAMIFDDESPSSRYYLNLIM